MIFSYTGSPSEKEQVFFRGSIYNKPLLNKQLKLEQRATDEITILAAYRNWGKDAPRHLDGDFIFAIADPRLSQVFCARDIFGVVPFYYHWDGKRFFASDSIATLLKETEFTTSPDPGFFAEYLSQNISSTRDTIYQNIKRLPASYCITISDSRFSLTRYYNPASVASSAISPETDYARRLRSLFSNASKKRIQSCSKFGVYLSGGVDSSSILASLDPETLTSAEIFSMKFEGKSCDESLFIKSVANKFKINTRWSKPKSYSMRELKNSILTHRDLPDFANNILAEPLKLDAQRAEVKVLLSGIGGDELFTGGMFPYSFLLRNLKVQSLFSQIRWDPRIYNLLSGLTPDFLKKALRRHGMLPTWIPAYLHDDFIEKSMIHSRLMRPAEFDFSCSLQKQRIIFTLFSGLPQIVLEQDYRNANHHSLLHRYPFLDREVLEFVLSVPDEMLMKDGVTKFILRQAFEDSLPSEVIHRTCKADFSYIFAELVSLFGGRAALRDLALYDEKILKRSEVYATYDKMLALEGRESAARYAWRIWAIICGDQVWRNLF